MNYCWKKITKEGQILKKKSSKFLSFTMNFNQVPTVYDSPLLVMYLDEEILICELSTLYKSV